MVAASLNRAFFIAGQAGVVPCAEAMPGVGKTETVRALANATGRHFAALMLDQCLPEDLGGFKAIRQVDVNGRLLDVMASILDERFIRCRLSPSILLVDELTNCPHTTQAAALQLIAEGIPDCWIFACCNPIHQAAAGVDLTPPMVNRMLLLPFETDRETVLAGWRNGLNFAAPTVPILPADWRENLPRWGSLAAAFIEQKPDLLEQFPRDPAQASKPFPSPRSWTNAVKLLAANDSVGDDPETRATLLHGTIGNGAAREFIHWLDVQGLPDPEFLLANPGRLALPRRGDLAMSIVRSVLSRVRADRTPDRWEALCDLVEAAHGQNAEVTTAALGDVWKLKPDGHTPKPRNGRWQQMNRTLAGAQ